MHTDPTLFQALRTRGAGLLALAALLLLQACGGGVGSGGTGGEASAYAAGPITGFGSVIVGGVRFDDSTAAVEDGDGVRRSRDELRLGMTVEVDSGAVASDATARATRVRFESELVGLVGLVDTTGNRFTMLGQVVAVDASTVFDERLEAGLAGLRTGQPVEVYAVFDAAAGRYRATRVEPSTLLAGLRLRGPVSQLDPVAQRLQIGGQDYSYAGASGMPATLAVGQYVRLRLALVGTDTLLPRWGVQSFGAALQALPDIDDVKLEGLISAFGSATAFSVNGRPVDASAARFDNGSAGLAAGVRVTVRGRLSGGTLRASEVGILSDDAVRDRGFELFGAITAVSAAQATISLRGVTVSTARSDLRFDGGSAADLQVGRAVEVRGGLAADRRTLEATRIRFR